MPAEIIHIAGFGLAVCIGIVLGMLGGGGAILTVPVLVYMMNVPTDHATAYSLFIVGISAALGCVRYVRTKQVDWKIAFSFLIPSMLAVLATRHFVLPEIPEVVFSVKGHEVTRKPLVMMLFAIILIVAGFSMLRNMDRLRAMHPEYRASFIIIPAWGVVVGFLSGLLGAGGGFMIVPVLVLLLNVPMKTAVGTSITIIAIQSLVGFAGDLGTRVIDWKFLLLFTVLALLGMLFGTSISRKSKPHKLRLAFGWLVLGMALVILTIEATNL